MKQIRRLRIETPAKLNLYLRILNKRKDNYHALSTLFARIGLYDTLILEKRRDSLITIGSSGIKVPGDSSNLCYRAAELLRQEAKLPLGVSIELKKRIPVGAGLGGGSSDAAGVLLGLNKLWGLRLPVKKLLGLAAAIGSDVPFFLHNIRFGRGSGRGDKVENINSLSRLRLWFVLVYPGFKVSTPVIYRKFDDFYPILPQKRRVNKGKKVRIAGLTRPVPDVKMLISELSEKGKKAGAGCFYNSLEAVTCRLYPEVNQARNALFGIGLEKVMMSGSGPAVFGLCDSSQQARRIRNKLLKQHRSWQVFAVPTA